MGNLANESLETYMEIGYYKGGSFISADDENYRKYLKTLCIRRKKLWIKSIVKRLFNEK